MNMKQRQKLHLKQTPKFWLSVGLVFLFCVSLVQSAKASGASFYLSPSFGSYEKGERFSMDVMIDVAGTFINAAQATIYFSTDKLEVLEVLKQDSIFSFWPKEPTFSNFEGKISFVAGVPRPGFIGRGGKIMTVFFQAKTSEIMKITFDNEKILANDPKGEDIFSFSKGVSYNAQGPRIEISIDNKGDSTNPQPLLYLTLENFSEQISYYEVEIEDNLFKIEREENLLWQIPNLVPGDYSIIVRAVDEKGNIVENSTQFVVDSILEPEITFCPKLFKAGEEILYIRGSSVPDSQVLINLLENDKLVRGWQVNSDEDGNWFLRDERLLNSGIYNILAQARDARGAVSNPSKTCLLNVILSGITMGPVLLSYKNLASITIVLLVLLLNLIFYLFLKIGKTQKLIKRETKDLKDKFYEKYNELKDDIGKELKFLHNVKKGVEFTKEEKEFEKKLLEDLDNIKKILDKELEDIEKII